LRSYVAEYARIPLRSRGIPANSATAAAGCAWTSNSRWCCRDLKEGDCSRGRLHAADNRALAKDALGVGIEYRLLPI
jgi:hypothetical protein